MTIQRRQLIVIGHGADHGDDGEEVRAHLHEEHGYELVPAVASMHGILVDDPEHPPICVLIDSPLADTVVLEWLEALRGPDGTMVCPTVVITTRAGRAAAVLGAGAHELIRRAASMPEVLGQAIEHAVARWKLTREHAQARLALQSRERVLQALADHTPDIITRFDREHRHVFVNAAVTRATGFGPADYLGKTHAELGMPAAHCALWSDALESVFATGLPRSIEFAFPAPEGERHYAARLIPELGPDREVEFVLDITTDVTETRRVMLAHEAKEAQLRIMEDSMPQLVWRGRASGLIEHYNARIALYDGVERRQDGSWSWAGLIHPDDMAPAREAWLVANAAQQPYVHEHRLRMADGTYRWHLSRANLTREHDAELRWYGTSTDIHERKQTEEQLAATLQLAEEAVQARDHLVSMVSHDLNNPLNVMTMAVTSLQVQLADGAAVAPELLRSVVDLIARQAARMSKLIEELLDVAQLQAGSPLALVRGDTDLVVLTLAIAEEYQRSAPSHRIEVRPRAPSLVGDWDPPRITRVVSNLISNAIKYSPNGGRVLVELAETRDGDHRWAVLTIEDEGIGIAPADLASVFEWFTRGENAQRTHIKGTGIGLAGARDIVMLHGGSIMLASEEGRGSSFTVKLPMPG